MEIAPVLCELHNSGKVSLVSDHNLAIIEDLTNNNFWSVVHVFVLVIPELDCTIRDMLRLVHTLVSKAGSDGAAGMPYPSLVQWCRANPDKAKLIVEGAMSLDKLCLSHCVFAVQGLGSMELAFELLGHSEKVVVAVGFCSLGRLEVGSNEIAKRVIDECCNAIAIENDQDVRCSAMAAAFSTWDKFGSEEPYRQQEFVGAIISANQGVELVRLSSVLFYHSKGLMAETVDSILEALAVGSSDPHAILYWLNSALHSNDKGWSLAKVIDVFAARIPQLNSPIKSSKYNNFCKLILEDHDNSARLFSSWLVAGQCDLCRFLADMVGEASELNKAIVIPRKYLPSDLRDQVFLARRCVGFLWLNAVTAVSILLCIVKDGKKGSREEAEGLIYDPLLLSYGGTLRSFLDELRNNPSRRISGCIERISRKHDAYLAGLRTTEHLVEFFPTIEQRRAAATKDRDLTKESQRQAHEEMVLFQLVSRQTLLYGKQSFYLMHGEDGKKVPSVMPLSEFSYDIEFPRLSVVDPTGFHEMIAVFRI